MPESSLQIQVERIAEGHLCKANSVTPRASHLGAGAMHCASPRHYSSPPIANPADIAAAMAPITSAVVPGALTRARRTAAVELVAAPDTPDLPSADETRLGRDHAAVAECSSQSCCP